MREDATYSVAPSSIRAADDEKHRFKTKARGLWLLDQCGLRYVLTTLVGMVKAPKKINSKGKAPDRQYRRGKKLMQVGQSRSGGDGARTRLPRGVCDCQQGTRTSGSGV